MKFVWFLILLVSVRAAGQSLPRIRNLTPHASINKTAFARAYKAHPDRWQKAFDYLRRTDLDTVQPGRYELDGDNVYVLVTKGPLRSKDSALWESHKRYADIHYVAKGRELIGVAPFTGKHLVKDYDAVKDIAFYQEKGTFYTATPTVFFIFFAGLDAHMPGLQTKGADTDRKVVVKVKTAD